MSRFKKKKKLCIVTGAGGFLGSHLCEHLLAEGHSVLGISRSKGFLRFDLFNNPRFYFIEKDLLNLSYEHLVRIFPTVDMVFHLASQQPSSNKLSYEDFYVGNVLTTKKIIELVKCYKNKVNIIYASTINVFKPAFKIPLKETSLVEPLNYYALTKYIAENLFRFYVKNFSKDKIAVIRLPSVFGKNHFGGIIHTICNLAKSNETIELYSKGEFLRSFVYYRTVLGFFSLVSQKLNSLEDYNLFLLADQPAVTLKDITKKILDLLESKSNVLLSDKNAFISSDIIINLDYVKQVLGFRPRNIFSTLEAYIREVWM